MSQTSEPEPTATALNAHVYSRGATSYLPPWVRAGARALRYTVRNMRYMFGRTLRSCPVCGHSGRFFSYGSSISLGVNIDVLCPRCLSLERHRLLALCVDRERLIQGKDVLHFAPEPCLERFLRSCNPARYTTCDYNEKAAELQINIEAIALPDAAYDVVICAHVLEHVDDRRALPELARVVKPGGLLLAMVPIVEGWSDSYENPAMTKRVQDRITHFNQHDHVRFYGRDFRDRLASVGFQVSEYTAEEPDVSRYGLMRGEKVFICRRAD
jgi:SAM-dependent methyltransferase